MPDPWRIDTEEQRRPRVPPAACTRCRVWKAKCETLEAIVRALEQILEQQLTQIAQLSDEELTGSPPPL